MATVMEPRRALILYATMTKNTEKVATWFNETFNEYGWETNLIRLMPNTNWAPPSWAALCFSPSSKR